MSYVRRILHPSCTFFENHFQFQLRLQFQLRRNSLLFFALLSGERCRSASWPLTKRVWQLLRRRKAYSASRLRSRGWGHSRCECSLISLPRGLERLAPRKIPRPHLRPENEHRSRSQRGQPGFDDLTRTIPPSRITRKASNCRDHRSRFGIENLVI